MESILWQFYEVMCKYEKHFAEQGVRDNLRLWEENKSPLIYLLRNHPDWDEDALAIILPVTESREIARATVNERRCSLMELTAALDLSAEQIQQLCSCVEIAAGGYSVVISENIAIRLNDMVPLKCVSGQKTSRVINKLCKQFGVDRHNEYNARFAQLADALNPISVSRKLLLSVHPCDYLEMSSKSSSWTSCHGLAHGGYQAGCLSYLTDGVSMILYTVDADVSGEYHRAPRRSRQVFCYGDGVLLQSRLYPNLDDTTAITRYRALVQDAIAVCHGVSSQWVAQDQADNFYSVGADSKQYPDYNSNASVTTLKGMDAARPLLIGHSPVCVCCGETAHQANELKCGCERRVVCMDCGETVHEDRARYHEEKWVCTTCLHICPICGQQTREALISAYDGRGNAVSVCADCLAVSTAVCDGCGIQAVCDTIIGNRFCARAAVGNDPAPLRRAA
ncbi:MAG: hypothetical protein LBT36_03710 [Oscillospiraceae bacterium]|jgi:hypothetical protein|nr:hypothetical protein [Oscillospiraceae bacterium]